MSLKSIFTQIYSPIVQKSSQIVEEAQFFATKANSMIVQGWIRTQGKWPAVAAKLHKVWEIIKTISKISFCILMSYFFVYNLPTCFFLGAAAALVFPREMSAAVERISRVWNSLPLWAKVLILVPAPITFFNWGVIAVPFVAGAECLWLQEKLGIKIPEDSDHHLPHLAEIQTPPPITNP